MPIDQPPAIQQTIREVTGQEQWTTLMDAIIREEAIVRQRRADVMNYTGAANSARNDAAAAEVRVAALQEMLKMLRAKLVSQGLKFIEDEWQSPRPDGDRQ